MDEATRLAHDYASILNAMVEMAKERGMQNPGSEYALACYQLLEAAISDAAVWEVPLAEIGLDRFDTDDLLDTHKKSGSQVADVKPDDGRSRETAVWQHYWSITSTAVSPEIRLKSL